MIAKMGKASRKLVIFGLKLIITCGCFWYVLRQVAFQEIFRETVSLNYWWFAAAVVTMATQIPLVALRWTWITNALEPQQRPVPLRAMIAISFIANFLSQALPNLMGDAMRVWMLSRLGSGWRVGLVGVVIDRGVGIGALLAIGFVTLLHSSTFTQFAGYRWVLLLAFGALLLSAVTGLAGARLLMPLLTHYRATRWMSEFILASRRVLIESPAAILVVTMALIIHLLSIVAIWELGQAFVMSLGVEAAAVLFTLMVAAAIVPVSVSGWGLREMMVTAFLTAHGMPAQRALLFSISFGLILILASTPGAVVMMFYSPGNAQPTRPTTI